MKNFKTPLEALKYHVSGAIERGEGEAVTAVINKYKHTPGPWVASKRNQRTIVQQVLNDSYAVAEVHAVYGNEAEANARLIAAAPEMLEALEAIFINHEVKGMSETLNNKALAAIRKAKGEI